MSSESFFSKIKAFFGFGKSSSNRPGPRQTRESNQLKLYVGNLSYDVTEDDLRQAFSAYGRISSVSVVRDRYSNQSKGFGFVEMGTRSEAQAAMHALNRQELKGRALAVNEARPRPEGSGGRGGYRRGRGGNWKRGGSGGSGSGNGGGRSQSE